MRTNIDVDEKLIEEVVRLSNSKNMKMAMEKAIRNYLQFLTQKEILGLRGKINWEGDLDEMRTSKYA